MNKKLQIMAVLLGFPGFLIQIYGLATGWPVLSLIGAGALCVGLGCDINRKGYHPLWGLWGLVPVMGPILLLLQPPHPRVFDLEYSVESFSEDETFERAIVAKEPAFISGGPLLLAALAPVGLFIHLFCGLAPHFITMLETTPTKVVAESNAGATPSQSVETSDKDVQKTENDLPKNAATDSNDAGTKSESPASTSEKPASASLPAPEQSTTPPPPPPAELPPPPPPPVVPAAAPPRELSYEEKFQEIQTGMTYEQVCEIIGHDSSLISGTLAGDKIVRWENPDKSYFAARFRGNALERKTNLSYPPPAKKLEEMAPELRYPGEESENIQTERKTEPTSMLAEQNIDSDEEQSAEESDDSSETSSEDVESESASAKGVIRVGGEKAEPRKFKARLPKYTQTIAKGPHDVYFHNESGATVQVALRTQTKRGRNITISSGDEAAAYLPNGTYNIVYISSDDPYKLKSAGQLVVASPHETLHVSLN